MSGRQVWDVTDRDGFMACYDATRLEVYRYASQLTGERHLAEDLIHDVYLETLRRATADRGLEPIGAGWLCRAVRHRFLDRVRSDKRERRRLRLLDGGRADEHPESDTTKLLAGLSDRERAAVVLRHVDGLSVAEVATALGTTVRAIESLLSRAKVRARRTYGEESRDA